MPWLPHCLPTALALSISAFSPPSAHGDSVADFVPDTAAAYVFLPNAGQVVADFRSTLESMSYQQSDPFRLLMQRPGVMPARLAFLSMAQVAGKDGWGAAEALAGNQLIAALGPGEDPAKPGLLIVTRLDEADAVDSMLTAVHSFAGMVQQDGTPNPAASVEIAGSLFFKDPKGNLHGRVGPTLVFCSSQSLLTAALSAHAAASHRLSDLPEWAPLAADHTASTRALFHLDAQRFIAATAQPDAWSKAGILQNNPAGGVIVAGLGQALAHISTLSGSLSTQGRSLKLSSTVSQTADLPATHAAFLSQPAGSPAFDASRIPGFIGEYSLSRNWPALYADRESFLDLNAAGQFVNFANTMTTLMGGLNYAEDYLPRITGPVRFIAAYRSFDASPYRPTPQLPAFAWITSLEYSSDPAFARRLFAGTQMAVTVASLDRTQKGQPSYMLETGEYRGQKIMTTFFSAAPESSMGAMSPAGAMLPGPQPDQPAPAESARIDVPTDYNFEPAAALVNGQYIITTSTDLLNSIIDEILDHSPGPEAVGDALAFSDRLRVSGSGALQALRANFTEIVTSRMLKADLPKARVEKEVSAALRLGDLFDSFDMRTLQQPRSWSLDVTLAIKTDATLASESQPALQDSSK